MYVLELTLGISRLRFPDVVSLHVSIPVKISMVLSRSAGDDARPHWLITPGRGHGRIGLIRREVATSAKRIVEIVDRRWQVRPRAISYLRSPLICTEKTDRKRLADKFRTKLAAEPLRYRQHRSFCATWIYRKSISDQYFRRL